MPRYLVLTLRTPNFDLNVVPDHYAFLDRLKSEERLEMAGPFTDKTGGAYLLKAAHLEEAKQIAFADPLHSSGSSVVTVKEWNA
ncbi:YciI family protein [Roseateles albus]|uniref:YciI family protein n=1 Tax=Roseateles albus TaxID=2987525 RepID=A0ABT5KGI8_9BURK|nr:YciI family protein [Roseateles albus]MDC8773032.1 YciI family protein [Roseateles albus]